jgi:hypothetical protein
MEPMTEVQNLILDHLRYSRSAIDEMCEDMREVKTRLDNLIEAGAKMGLDARSEGIECRLGVIERDC